MTLNELGAKLGEMYNNAPKGDSTAMIHLFGINFAELNKGVKLAVYVNPKN